MNAFSSLLLLLHLLRLLLFFLVLFSLIFISFFEALCYVLQTITNFRNFRWNTRMFFLPLSLGKVVFRTLNQSCAGLCQTLNKILFSLWSFKLSAICSQICPHSGFPPFREYGWNNNITLIELYHDLLPNT